MTVGERKPVKVSVVMQMDPMSCYADDLDALAHQFAGWIVNNVTKMTERMGGDLFVAVVTACEGQRGSMSYRDGRFVKDETARPVSPSETPADFRWVPKPEGHDWRLEADRQCRWMSDRVRCPQAAVAALNRGRRRYGKGVADSWWAYCADHMYGRWIEDGAVMHWILVEIAHGGDDQ